MARDEGTGGGVGGREGWWVADCSTGSGRVVKDGARAVPSLAERSVGRAEAG